MVKIILTETNGNQKVVDSERYSWEYATEKDGYYLMDKELGCIHKIISLKAEDGEKTIVCNITE